MIFPFDHTQIPWQPIHDGHSTELRLLSTSSCSKVSSTVRAQFITAIVRLVLRGTHNTSDMRTAINFAFITEEKFKLDLVISNVFSSLRHASQHQFMSMSDSLLMNSGREKLKLNSLTVFSYALQALATESYNTPKFHNIQRHMAGTLLKVNR